MSKNETKQSLIEAVEGLRCCKTTCVPIAHEVHEQALDRVIALIRQHEAETLQSEAGSFTEGNEAQESGEWKPTILQLRNLYHKHIKLKSEPLAEDSLEMWVFNWAIKQLKKRTSETQPAPQVKRHVAERTMNLNTGEITHERIEYRDKAPQVSAVEVISTLLHALKTAANDSKLGGFEYGSQSVVKKAIRKGEKALAAIQDSTKRGE